MPVAWDTLGTGGPIIALLALLSLFSLTLIAVKVIQLWPVRSGAARRAEAFRQWREGDKHAAQKAVAGGASPADRVTAYAMQALAKGFRGPRLEAELMRRGNEEVARMTGMIRTIELIAVISPLLGLLGTVLGMIQSFQELELAEGAANASVLAGGIWQALLTTAAGLLVAIPAAVAAGLLSSRIDSAAHMIESAVGELLLSDENPPV
ncbi:MotA/TolQ/ExbB proton channel family protein [Antarcticimicrobium luteum]|uniref:MotA/TolQ/ExbB proton channel family protein n=1 Tax=Antarcticimicrobium luteum TaxID=2547397 RepID=A0A4R5VH28_9RHOB|nr:MotA/TolQ/ExbB proton channel family protein [Antarcticimicrobium luteum]TDK53029.1 MotA/TolQ/ExbB proton channel family protein [Antarcticimicrobium luteum]